MGFPGCGGFGFGLHHTIFESVQGGLDLVNARPRPNIIILLGDAVQFWQIDEAAIDQQCRRVLRLVILSGRMINKSRRGRSIRRHTTETVSSLAEEAITVYSERGGRGSFRWAKSVKSIAVIWAECRRSGHRRGRHFHRSRIVPGSAPLEALQKKAGRQRSSSNTRSASGQRG